MTSKPARWLPSLLRASHVVELEIRQDKQRVTGFADVQQQTDESLLIAYSEAIPNQAGMRADFKLDRPFKEFEYSMKAMFGISGYLHRGVRALVLHPLAPSAVARCRAAGGACPADPGWQADQAGP